MKNVLVVAPHPDDEVLGCGGTLLKHCRSGDRITIVYVTQMQLSQGFLVERIQSRQREIETVCKMLTASAHQFNYPPATLTDEDSVSMIAELSEVFGEVVPDVLYLPNRSDAHSDHGICFKAAYACSKIFRCPSLKTILVYETVSETDFSPALASDVFIPNYFVDVSDHMEGKISMMRTYSSEISEHPFPRSIASINALATVRGAAAGVASAEAFQLIKHIC